MMLDRRHAIYVGNLGPIPLFLHWSFVFLLWMVFQRSSQGHLDVTGLLLFTTVLLGGIVLHEMGHGLAAKALGAMGVTITLWAFGGLCSSTRDRLPRREIIILAAGPAVSFLLWWTGWLAIKLIFATNLAVIFDDPYRMAQIHQIIALDGPLKPEYAAAGNWLGQGLCYLMTVNWWLGMFNIFPIYPLDGGQIVFNALSLFLREQVAAKVALSIAVLAACSYLAWDMHVTGEFNTYLAMLLGYLLFNAFTSLG